MGALLSGQAENDSGEDGPVDSPPSKDPSKTAGVQAHPGGPQTWVNTDFYAQVSNVMPSGGVVLSPGQQLRIQESLAATKVDEQSKVKDPKDGEGSEEVKEGEQPSQLLLVDPERSGYTMESNAQQFNTPPRPPELADGYKATNPQAAEHQQSPYILPDSPQTQAFTPVADYTVVQELDSQHSLLLNPPPLQPLPPSTPQNPLKALPAMPVGYVTPDLLGNLSP